MKPPKHIQDMVDRELERDRVRGNTFWTTPMTKEKLAPLTSDEISEAIEHENQRLNRNN